MNKTYADAKKLLDEYIENKNLKKHCYAVESAMKAYAEKFAKANKIPDIESEKGLWSTVGLLHDFDYEKFPKQHPEKGAAILKEQKWPEVVVKAVLSHADYTNTPRESLMEKTLFAVDELTGFIVACALVRPDRLASLDAKSVQKKMKDKSFAAKINRDDIIQGAEDLGIDLDLHIDFVIAAMQKDDRLELSS